MQYYGYLRRNPNDPQDSDYTGYDFWLTKLNQFGGNYNNAEMVKAFVSSLEYRQRVRSVMEEEETYAGPVNCTPEACVPKSFQSAN